MQINNSFFDYTRNDECNHSSTISASVEQSSPSFGEKKNLSEEWRKAWGAKRQLPDSPVGEDFHSPMRQVTGKQRRLNEKTLLQTPEQDSFSISMRNAKTQCEQLSLDKENVVNEEKISSELPRGEVNGADFFVQTEPKVWYSLNRNPEGRIEVNLTSFKKIKKLIYVFRNKEKQRLLIGKTGGSLNKRISSYIAQFNGEGTEKKVKKEGRKTFLMDVKKNPEHFDVGVLHILTPEEDLELFETLFIQHKRLSYHLYNENDGGGGGCAHSEEKATIYALPKAGTLPFTPIKYYRFQKNDRGEIRPQFSPGFKEMVGQLTQGMEETQGFLYAIKELPGEDQTHDDSEEKKRYIGVTGRADPSQRAREHGYRAEYYDPSHKKFDPSQPQGSVHPAIATAPEKYGFGLFPLKSIENISLDQYNNYLLLNGIAKVENYAIKVKKSHISQNGFNGNYGGGGPIAKRMTQASLVKKKLKFDDQTCSELDD